MLIDVQIAEPIAAWRRDRRCRTISISSTRWSHDGADCLCVAHTTPEVSQAAFIFFSFSLFLFSDLFSGAQELRSFQIYIRFFPQKIALVAIIQPWYARSFFLFLSCSLFEAFVWHYLSETRILQVVCRGEVAHLCRLLVDTQLVGPCSGELDKLVRSDWVTTSTCEFELIEERYHLELCYYCSSYSVSMKLGGTTTALNLGACDHILRFIFTFLTPSRYWIERPLGHLICMPNNDMSASWGTLISVNFVPISRKQSRNFPPLWRFDNGYFCNRSYWHGHGATRRNQCSEAGVCCSK